MWQFHELRYGLALAALLCNLSAESARAAEDFALLEVVLDGRAIERVAGFVMRDGQLYATRMQWRDLGIPPRYPATQGASEQDLLGVEAMRVTQVRMDLSTRSLHLRLAPDPAALSVVNGVASTGSAVTESGLGAVLNVDAVAQRAFDRTIASGLFEARVFGPLGLLEHRFIATSAADPAYRRLETAVTLSDTASMRRLRVGDFVSNGLSWTRPVRMVGGQVATDFSLRPDLVTTPAPVLSGTAAVPSTVDVLINGVRHLSEPVEAGRFEVRQVPMVSGLGEVSVIVRDVLGREQLQTLPFYGTPRQLATGLWAHAVEVGWVRRGFGTPEDRYADPAASASLRHGVSSDLTLEAHAEATRGVSQIGAGGVLNLGSVGAIHGAIVGNTSGRLGAGQASLGFERQSSTLSVNTWFARATSDYRDIAAAQGDAFPLRSARLGLGWNLEPHGSVGAALIDNLNAPAGAARPALRTRLASTTYSRSIAGGVHSFVNAYRDLMNRSSGVTAGVIVAFGCRASAAASVGHDAMGTTASVFASRPATAPEEFGWRLQSDRPLSGSAPRRTAGLMEYLGPAGRVGVEAERVNDSGATRVSLQTSLLALGGRVQLARPSNDSVALVDVAGQAGVAVYHENRLVGRTDAAGQVVVPGLLSYQRNRLAIDVLDLPLDAQAEDLAQDVRPADRSGLLVRFNLSRPPSALVVVQDADGQPVPVGARARLQGTAVNVTAGHDGEIYLRGLSERNELWLTWGRAAQCFVRFSLAERDSISGRIGPLRCRSVS